MAQSAVTSFTEVVKNADEYRPTTLVVNALEGPCIPAPNRDFSLTQCPSRKAEYRLAGHTRDD
ncbi:hypothetical protein [Streptomyces sp. NPDC048442]|uniref:hypothetical protein n=1 Tax=Streptomyces sp. NPDC048442 TaxID=3154823 RepID=UPI0034222ECC